MHASRSREETRGRVNGVVLVWKKGVGVGYPSGLIEKGVVRCETGSAQLLMQLALQPNFIFLIITKDL